MANNFFLNQDPLLYNGRSPQNDEEMRRQLNDAIAQYQQLQQRQQQNQPSNADYLTELDGIVSGISDDVKERLGNDKEYCRLNGELQAIINREIIWSIKGRINSNQDAVRNMLRQKEIIRNVKDECDDEQRRNISELNDYVKNYSDITFDEYKKIKEGGDEGRKKRTISDKKKE